MSEINKQNADKACQIIKFLTDKTKIDMINHLRKNKELSVNDLVSRIDLQQPTISYHLILMHQYGILNKRKKGKFSFYQVNEKMYGEMIEIINRIAKL